MELSLDSSVRYLPNVGPVMARRLEKLGIITLLDLLFYAPFRYDNYTLVSPIANIQPGEVVTIQGTIEWIKSFLTKRGKKIQQAMIADATGKGMAIWFNQPYLMNVMQKGATVSLAGEVGWFGRQIALTSPDYEIVNVANSSQPLHTGRLVPIYSETEGLSSKWLRSRISFALEHFLSLVPEEVPDSIRNTYHLVDIQNALQSIHFPQRIEVAIDAKRRLAFHELFLTHLRAKIMRWQRESIQKSYAMQIPTAEISSFIASLPFVLTNDQTNATKEILTDFTKPYPANRLLEGDVGAGKTVVAAVAMVAVRKNNLRSILMAPTEILATQHYETISKFLTPRGITVGLVTGSTKKEATKNDQAALFTRERDSFDILVGTHALLTRTEGIENVGLVVIDEQQRFGVRQRQLLRVRGAGERIPHLLTMTATPIPRTIALTMYGNLDISVLHTLPTGRKRVKTWVVPKEKRKKAYNWISQEVERTEGQAFILCPLIEESESLGSAKAATHEYERLQKGEFKHLRIGLLHGRMKSEQKQKILTAFRKKEFDILVTTPVVEVGIDIPNATIMMVEAADRFGLGQLHQLRGRVGRGEKNSYCLLFTEEVDEKTLSRLKALETMFSGPTLAEFDLKLRGPGEVFGIRQHGVPLFRFANFTDTELIAQTQEAARDVLAADPELTSHPLLREKIKNDTIEKISED